MRADRDPLTSMFSCCCWCCSAEVESEGAAVGFDTNLIDTPQRASSLVDVDTVA